MGYLGSPTSLLHLHPSLVQAGTFSGSCQVILITAASVTSCLIPQGFCCSQDKLQSPPNGQEPWTIPTSSPANPLPGSPLGHPMTPCRAAPSHTQCSPKGLHLSSSSPHPSVLIPSLHVPLLEMIFLVHFLFIISFLPQGGMLHGDRDVALLHPQCQARYGRSRDTC
jgi:hypothetical protein